MGKAKPSSLDDQSKSFLQLRRCEELSEGMKFATYTFLFIFGRFCVYFFGGGVG